MTPPFEILQALYGPFHPLESKHFMAVSNLRKYNHPQPLESKYFMTVSNLNLYLTFLFSIHSTENYFNTTSPF